MSGHNKWSQIKHKKAKEDAKKGKAFTKLIKEITVAARLGGGDPALNAPLRHLLEEARFINMPLDNATRAIKRGTGELPGVNYEPITYEGYGPYGTAIIVDTLSDNRNRTVAELRFIFNSHNGNLGESGSVSWMFNRLGIIQTSAAAISEEKILELLLEFDLQDIELSENSYYIFCEPKARDSIANALTKAGYRVESNKTGWIPTTTVVLSEEQAEKVIALLSALEDHDDVQEVYSNLG